MRIRRMISQVMIVASLPLGLLTGQAIAPTVIGAVASAAPVYEDSTKIKWKCTRGGNRICGPGAPGHAPAGFYNRQGQMIKAWTNYTKPWKDDLSGLDLVTAEKRYGHLAPLPADQVPAWQHPYVWTDAAAAEAKRDLAAKRTAH
jgi:hypothetical protein